MLYNITKSKSYEMKRRRDE